MFRRVGVLTAGTVLGAVLAGCGATPAEPPADAGPADAGPADTGPTATGPAGTDRPPPVAPGDPVALIGSWRVVEADGEEAGAVLRLAGGQLSVWRRCGQLAGAWRASRDGLFVAHVSGGSSACVAGSGTEYVPAWLRRAQAFRLGGEGHVLLDQRGGVVARLLPGGRPTAGPDIAASEAEPPTVTDEDRAGFAAAAPLPATLRAPRPDELLGRWVPAGREGAGAPRPPFAQLLPDGRWRGSDGCNGQSGRWAVGPAGAFLAVAGAQTLIGCDGAAVGGWLAGASRVGFDGTTLVLLDRSGTELGRLVPAAR